MDAKLLLMASTFNENELRGKVPDNDIDYAFDEFKEILQTLPLEYKKELLHCGAHNLQHASASIDCQSNDVLISQNGNSYCFECNMILPKTKLRCSRCKKTYYCSKQCQSKHWKDHKFFCA